MYGYIYITQNTINERLYVGQHKGKFDKNYHGSGKIINQAIEKYGEENFITIPIEYCETRSELNEAEKKWIWFFNAIESKLFYNIAKGGEGGHTIAGYNEEQMKRYSENMSKALKGRQFTDEHKKKISESLKKVDRMGAKNNYSERCKVTLLKEGKVLNFDTVAEMRNYFTNLGYKAVKTWTNKKGVPKKLQDTIKVETYR